MNQDIRRGEACWTKLLKFVWPVLGLLGSIWKWAKQRRHIVVIMSWSFPKGIVLFLGYEILESASSFPGDDGKDAFDDDYDYA
jgi:hypothetical protein